MDVQNAHQFDTVIAQIGALRSTKSQSLEQYNELLLEYNKLQTKVKGLEEETKRKSGEIW
jgi:regulator of replication initiation timing